MALPIEIPGMQQAIQQGLQQANRPTQGIQRTPASGEIENLGNQKHFDISTGRMQDSFADMLTKAINGVDQTMKGSEQKMQDYVSGKTDNVHDVMISMQQAQLSFQLMVEVRNKAIDTYNEISRMSI